MNSSTFILSAPGAELANILTQCRNWREVEEAIAAHPDHKIEAWRRLPTEEKTRVKELKQRATEAPTLKIGCLVRWVDCPGCIEFFNPFTVREVEGDEVWLDWVAHPVERSRLVLEEFQ